MKYQPIIKTAGRKVATSVSYLYKAEYDKLKRGKSCILLQIFYRILNFRKNRCNF